MIHAPAWSKIEVQLLFVTFYARRVILVDDCRRMRAFFFQFRGQKSSA